MIAAAHERVARPIDLPLGDAHGCAMLKVLGVEAGPTVLADGFEKDLGAGHRSFDHHPLRRVRGHDHPASARQRGDAPVGPVHGEPAHRRPLRRAGQGDDAGLHRRQALLRQGVSQALHGEARGLRGQGPARAQAPHRGADRQIRYQHHARRRHLHERPPDRRGQRAARARPRADDRDLEFPARAQGGARREHHPRSGARGAAPRHRRAPAGREGEARFRTWPSATGKGA